jgi:hypothetical protein
MLHIAEMIVLFMLLALGQSVIHPAPYAARRALGSFLIWCGVFGAVIVVIQSPPAAAWVVRIAICLLVAYAVQWLLGHARDVVCGPRLFETPDASHLALAVHHVSGTSLYDCRRISRAMMRRFGGDLALLGLVLILDDRQADTTDLEALWQAKCEAARKEVASLAVRFNIESDPDRLCPADASVLVQSLCLFERDAVMRALADQPLGTNAARRRFKSALTREGKFHKAAEDVGLIMPVKASHKVGPQRRSPRPLIRLAEVLLPAWRTFRLGFRRRGLALGVSEGLLLFYGLYGMSRAAGRIEPTFFINTSHGIYIAAAAGIHIQAVFALEEFERLAMYLEAHAGRGETAT